MIIHMIAERPTDRLNWQYQLNQFRGRADFTLSPTIPSIDKLDFDLLMDEDIILILFNDLEGLDALDRLRVRVNRSTNVVGVISRECELNYGKTCIEKEFQEIRTFFGAFYYETLSSSETFYQCLFKPRKAFAMPDHPQSYEVDTVLIPLEETTKKKTEKNKGNDSLSVIKQEKSLGFQLFRKGKKRTKTWSEKLPRMRICVHGESALAYELGAVLSSTSEQSVLVMDLDRLSPTADVYCGVKPVVKEKYDFYSKATATGLNILLDCMKKSVLSRDVFRLCTQQPKGYPKLHILTGVYKLEDYEYYKGEDLKNLVDSASAFYDVIVLKTNSFPYDGFTLNSFLMVDAILWGGSPAIESIRYHRQLVQLMEAKQKIPLQKQLWTLFERPSMEGLEKNFLVEMGIGTYCGSIPYWEKREKCLRIGTGYLNTNRTELEDAYIPIIQAIYRGGV